MGFFLEEQQLLWLRKQLVSHTQVKEKTKPYPMSQLRHGAKTNTFLLHKWD